jgi:hypothetical protein
MLVFANPHQRVYPVPPYGIERIRTAIEGMGHQVTIEDPFLFDDEDGTIAIAALAKRTTALDPDIIGFSIRNADDLVNVPELKAPEEFCTIGFMPEIKRLRDAVGTAAPHAILLGGGAAFSMMPAEIMEALDLPFGVVGAGEIPFRTIVDRVSKGESFDDVEGLIRPGEMAPRRPVISFLTQPTIRDPRYPPSNYFAVRTRFGCGQMCGYCLIANYNRAHQDGDLTAILDEVADVVAIGRAKGMTNRIQIMFCDEEFNLPNESHPISMLTGIVERGLADDITWRAYFNPVPISDAFLGLVKRTSGLMSITMDSASDAVLKANHRPFQRRHLDDLVERIIKADINPFLGFLFGLPGETDESVEESIKFIRALPSNFFVNYEVGGRIYPNTGLERIAAGEPRHIYGPYEPGPIAPVVYCSPVRPRELTKRLQDALIDRVNVFPTSPAHRHATRHQAAAHRIARRPHDDKTWADWNDVLDRCAKDEWPQDEFEAVSLIARWADRPDLAAPAEALLAAAGGQLQPGLDKVTRQVVED